MRVSGCCGQRARRCPTSGTANNGNWCPSCSTAGCGRVVQAARGGPLWGTVEVVTNAADVTARADVVRCNAPTSRLRPGRKTDQVRTRTTVLDVQATKKQAVRTPPPLTAHSPPSLHDALIPRKKSTPCAHTLAAQSALTPHPPPPTPAAPTHTPSPERTAAPPRPPRAAPPPPPPRPPRRRQ